MTKYFVADREAGNKIEGFSTLKAAEKCLDKFEKQDKKDKTYVANFYEIIED